MAKIVLIALFIFLAVLDIELDRPEAEDPAEKLTVGVPMLFIGVFAALWLRKRWEIAPNRHKQKMVICLGILLVVAACVLSWLTEHLWPSIDVPIIGVVVLVGAGLFALRGNKMDKSLRKEKP